MGVCCASESTSGREDAPCAPVAKRMAVTSMDQKDGWKGIILGKDILLKSVHENVLTKFKSATDLK